MACFYCIQEGMQAADAGDCSVCKKSVCVHPNLSRADGVYHAEACHFCDQLVCELDFHDHSGVTHSSPPSSCFPGLVAEISTMGLVAASRASAVLRASGALSQQDQDAIVRYLNVVNPGRGALAVAAGLPPLAEGYVQPPAEVFSRPFLGTLGKDMAGQAGAALTQPTINKDIDVFGLGNTAIKFLTERHLDPLPLCEADFVGSGWLNRVLWESQEPLRLDSQLEVEQLRFFLDSED